jgi:hypothetical protein
MSIATLKKKTYAKYNNLSVGQPHFSINGTLRNQGYVGQTSLSRSLPRTLYNGAFPRGHGGCCGTFPIGRMVQSGIMPLNDPKVIKTSMLGSKGMLEEKLKCLNSLRVQGWNKKLPLHTPFTEVKQDNNLHNNDQGVHVINLAKKAINEYNICTPKNTIKKQGTCHTNVEVSLKTCNLTKDPSKLAAKSQGEHLIQLTNNCINSNLQNNVVRVLRTPIA